MARTITIHNVSGEEKTYSGQVIVDTETYTLATDEYITLQQNQTLFADVASGDVLVGDGTSDFTDVTEGWAWLVGDSQTVTIPALSFSDIDEKKLAVHTSYKPKLPGVTTYAIWAGAGDDITASPGGGLGEGELLDFEMTPQTGSPPTTQIVTKDVKFHPAHGRIWLHEGYLRFSGGGHNDYITSDVVADATPVQTFVDKILYIEDNWIKYAVGSPNPATHGWGGTPVLIPRTYANDGDWDYDGVNLTPNFTGTGGYKISDIERAVHRYINRIPCCGDSPYFSMTSDETTELPAGYFIRIHAHNVSNTTWNASVLMEIYRERTHQP